jgi:ELWxxDGT repeat protein
VADREFQSLSAPSTAEERDQALKVLFSEGCREPLVVWLWHGRQVLLLGYDLWPLLVEYRLPFRVLEKSFSSRQAAWSYVIREHLRRHYIGPLAASYLRGSRYEASKQPNGGDRRSVHAPAGTAAIRPGGAFLGAARLTNVNGTLFFYGADSAHGSGLWRSNGTAAGTVIEPGPVGLTPAYLANVNGTLFFDGTDQAHGDEPWVLGPLPPVPVPAAQKGASGLSVAGIGAGNEVGARAIPMYAPTGQDGGFSAAEISTVPVRWQIAGDGQPGAEDIAAQAPLIARRRDGTGREGAGRQARGRKGGRHGSPLHLEALEPRLVPSLTPHLLKDIHPGSASSLFFPTTFVNVNGMAYFPADDGVHGMQLWKSNGTAAGTVMVRVIYPGGTFFGADARNIEMANVNGTLFFAAGTASRSNFELWKSNGTAAGTVLVKDIRPGSASGYPTSLTNVNGTLFFAADDGIHGQELWKSNGTAAGTVLVKDVRPGSASAYPRYLTNFNGTLFFSADDGTHGKELWKSNDTAAGTVLVKDINPGSANSWAPTYPTVVNGILFFSAFDSVHGSELWKSNGTAAGTVVVKDINPGKYGS